MSEDGRYQFSLPDDHNEFVTEQAKSARESRSDIVRRAITMYRLIRGAEEQGKVVYLIDENGDRERLVIL